MTVPSRGDGEPSTSTSFPWLPYRSRAGSVSTASSLDGHGLNPREKHSTAPYRDNEDDYDGKDSIELEGQSVAGRRYRSVAQSDADVDLEDPEALEDDVALIQKERRAATTSRFSAGKTTTSRRKGIFIILVISGAALILIPLLQWLSSSPFASSPLGQTIAGLTNNTFFDSSLVDPSAALENHTPAIPEIDGLKGLPSALKLPASANTAEGQWGLARAKTAGFNVDFVVPGWNDGLTAAYVLNATSAPVRIADSQGGTKLRQITMDSVFDGTFQPQRSDLTWSEEGEYHSSAR